VDLTGYTARMQVRSSLQSSDVILSLTTQNGGIVLDNYAKTIELNISATQTSLLTFSQAVYDLEFITGSGEVIRFAEGKLTLKSEVTR
jgi:hypothetical protein